MAAVVDVTRYNELCRLCAAKTTMLLAVHIFHNDGIIGQLSKKIENCLSINVHETDPLPKMVCENCLYKLNLLTDFKERTLRTERLLSDLFKEFSANKIAGSVPMENEIIMVQNNPQLLPAHHLHTVEEIDLSQLSTREEMIVGLGHEIILHHHPPVDLNHLGLSHHPELGTSHQDISNHSLQTQDSLLVETSTDIDNARFGSDNNLDLIQHQHLLSEQFRLQTQLHVNISEASAVNGMNDGLGSSVNLKLESQNNINGYGLHTEKTLDFEPVVSNLNDISNHSAVSNNLSPPPEDSNSNTSLRIDDNNIASQDAKPGYLIQTDDSSNTVHSTAPSSDNWFCCNMCGKTFENESAFRTHYEGHFEKCNICLAFFNNVESLMEHKKETHGERADVKPIKTRLKRATLPINGEHSNDSNSEDSDKDYLPDPRVDPLEGTEENGNKKKTVHPRVCKECGKSYKTNYKLNEHMRRHTGEKPYKCTECDKEFRSKIGLAQHAAKHTGKYDYSCPTCNKGFQCKSYLMVHQRVHSDVKPYPCTTCGRNFKTKQSLLDHTNRHLGVKPYMCEICGRGFITKGLCKAHLKIHTGLDNRKFSCKVCQKMFVSKSYLQTHLRIHTGEKPFICEVCGKGFLTKVDLRIHTTMHTGEKSYVCEMCGKAFARRDALRCHRRSHTGERPYSCDLCGQTFTQFTPMAIHKRLHTGERPYACESCGKTFISRSTMMSHAKKHNR